MTVVNLNEFPVMNKSLNISSIQFTVLVVGLIKFLLLQILLHRKRISTFFSGFQSQFFRCDNPTKQVKNEEQIEVNEDDEINVEIVLTSLGMSCKDDDEKIAEKEIWKMFEETSPSLEEVKEAFDVFDSKRDGFIDAEELHKVFCDLGMKEGSEMESCRRMIGVFDEDGDGKIDFDEFVKLMENSFSN